MIGSSFAEGVSAIALPCSWVLFVPALLAVAGTGARRHSVAAIVGGLVFGLMLRASGVAVPAGIGGLVVAVFLGACFLLVLGERRVSGAAVGVGLGTAALWQPCVGPELGSILELGASAPISAAFTMIPYALGAVLPVPAMGFALELLPREASRRLRVPASVAGVLLAVAVAFGWHVPLVGALARWSLELSS